MDYRKDLFNAVRRTTGKAGARSVVEDTLDRLKELETRARKLANQNLADLIGAARGKLVQASEHKDLERVDADEGQLNMPFNPGPDLNSGGNAVFAAGDPGAAAQNEEALRRAAWPAPGAYDPNAKAPVPTGAPSTLDPDGTMKYPGVPDPLYKPEDNIG